MSISHNSNNIIDISRRNTLKFLTLSSLSLGLFTRPCSASEQALQHKVHIVIVGGGIGGASVAKYLRLLNPHV